MLRNANQNQLKLAQKSKIDNTECREVSKVRRPEQGDRYRAHPEFPY